MQAFKLFARERLMNKIYRSIITLTLLIAVFSFSALQSPSQAEEKTLKMAVLKFGTVNWLLNSMKHNEFDKQAGFNLEMVPLASKNATSVAFLSKSVDGFVTDWFWAMTQRQKDDGIFFMPYSTTLGALVVSPQSGINNIEDLKGKRIGIAGGPLDKSWLILQTLAEKKGAKNLAKSVEPVFGAPPLLNAQAESNEVAGVLNFWHFAARLKAKGFKPLLSVDEAMNELGVDPAPPMIGFVYHQSAGDKTKEDWAKYGKALQSTMDLLISSDAEWDRLRPLLKAKDDATFTLLRDTYRDGIERVKAGSMDTDAANKLYGILAEVGGEKVVGSNPKFDAALFTSPTQ